MKNFLIFSVSLITVLLLSCDSTQTSFDDTVPELFTLTTNVSPEESGNVIPSGGEFVNNSLVTVEAIPADGFRFDRWVGDLTSSVNPDSFRTSFKYYNSRTGKSYERDFEPDTKSARRCRNGSTRNAK